jgi:hypothetical protein
MRVLIFIIVTSVHLFAIGLDINIQKPFSAIGSWPAISLQLTKNSKWQPVYFSSGVVFRPGPAAGTIFNSSSVQENRKMHSFYGIYAGTFAGLAPIFRPGFIIGMSWKREEVRGVDATGKEFVKSYSAFQINPYFGMEVHCLIMSFIVTNEGFGAGVNLNLGRGNRMLMVEKI